jgi:hypothetical protein
MRSFAVMTHLAPIAPLRPSWPVPSVDPSAGQPAVAARDPAGALLADVKGLIGRVLVQAKAMGRDDLTQTRAAAHAVVAVRPDLTLNQAFNAVARMRALGAV